MRRIAPTIEGQARHISIVLALGAFPRRGQRLKLVERRQAFMVR
jgi:hypothetical protein